MQAMQTYAQEKAARRWSIPQTATPTFSWTASQRQSGRERGGGRQRVQCLDPALLKAAYNYQ